MPSTSNFLPKSTAQPPGAMINDEGSTATFGVQAHQLAPHNCHNADPGEQSSHIGLKRIPKCQWPDGFRHLLGHVATGAFDSDQKGDAPKCHPNTRTAVLDHIFSWIIQTATRTQWILWLFGAAGAGKSAIVRSMVEICTTKNLPFASFFFYRTDATRNHLAPFVATLLYQLISKIPDLRPIVIPKIELDPLIFTKSFQTQLEVLIFESLQQLKSGYIFQHAVVLLIDGLDECLDSEDQAHLIRVISKLIQTYEAPVIALFGSRTESQITGAFDSRDVSRILLRVPLDNRYLPDDDIRLFLRDSIDTIKESHPLRRAIDPDWPLPELLEEIVAKSSGQFIYASVVMNFISASRLHPAQQLDIVRGIRPSGSATPFAQLDALYRHIFSQVQDLNAVFSVLSYFLFADKPFLRDYCDAHNTTDVEIQVLLVDLTSVITVQDDQVQFLHASLPDFLRDAARSQGFHIEQPKWCTHLALQLFKAPKKTDRLLWDIRSFLPYVEPTPEIRAAILKSKWEKVNDGLGLVHYVDILKDVDLNDNGAVYNQQLAHITEVLQEEQPDRIETLREKHDIDHLLPRVDKGSSALKKPASTNQDTPLLEPNPITDLRRSDPPTNTVDLSHTDETAPAARRGSSRKGFKAKLATIFKIRSSR